MSMQLGQPRNAKAMLPTPPTGQRVAGYATYEAAQRAVDHLSDQHFAVEHITVVGEDLQLVERVTGRLTYAKVAVAGAGSGAWLGLFFGIVLTLFARGASSRVVIAAVLLGAAFGVLLAVVSFALTGGRRDFSSFTQMVAQRYVLLCRGNDVGQAYWLLQRLRDNPQLPDIGRPVGVGESPPTEGAAVAGDHV